MKNCHNKDTLLLLLLLFLFGNNVVSAISNEKKFCYYYDGYWGEWSSNYWFKIQGSYNGFIIYYDSDHPSDYFFKFEINNREAPDKKDIKEHYKSRKWWEYYGIVEYYVCDVYPTFEACIKEFGRPLMKKDVESESYQKQMSILRASKLAQGISFSPTGLRKKFSSGKIKIAPYPKKIYKPQVYNIWFDGVGMAIDLNGAYFQNSW